MCLCVFRGKKKVRKRMERRCVGEGGFILSTY